MVETLRLRDRGVEFHGTRTRGDAVFDVLMDAIVKVDLRPGEALAKDAIAAELGVSRTPVGDAINRLAALGLVSVIPQVGSFVSRISPQAVIESSFLRSAVEGEVTHRLASSANRTLTGELRRRLDEQGRFVADGDVDRFHEADDEFHSFMVTEAGVGGIWDQIAPARLNLVRIRRLGLPQPGRLAAAHAEHIGIVDEIEARRPRRAAKAVADHIRYAEVYLKQLEAEAPSFFE